MKKKLIIVAAASLTLLTACSATTGSASQQSSNVIPKSSASNSSVTSNPSVMTRQEADSKLSKGMTQDQVRAIFGAPSREGFSSSGVSWTYEKLYAGTGDGFNRQSSSRTVRDSGSSNRSIGRGLGTILGGSLGRVARGAGDLAEGVTGRQSTTDRSSQSSGAYGGGPEVLRPGLRVHFDTSGRIRQYRVES